jgi:hypothetical protein
MIGQHKPTRDNKDCTFEDFQKAGEASFEHHWNNHEHCGSWCQAKSWTEEEKVKGKRKYRDKETHEREYKQQLQVKEKYLSPERLSKCFHEFCNNKTEQIHGLVVNVLLPKRAFLCGTICGRSCTYMAVGIDSSGYKAYFKELYDDLGIEMLEVTLAYCQEHDRRIESARAHAKKQNTKKKRAKNKLAIMSSAWKTEVEDKNNGHTYQSRMTVPAGAALNVKGDEEDLVAVAAAPYCGACGNYGHQRRTSHLCTQNIRCKKYQGMYVK